MMTAKIIDGTAIADEMRIEIAQDAARFNAHYGYPPGLGVVLVGDDPASAQYVRMKRRACEKAGITSVAHVLNADSTQEEARSSRARVERRSRSSWDPRPATPATAN